MFFLAFLLFCLRFSSSLSGKVGLYHRKRKTQEKNTEIIRFLREIVLFCMFPSHPAHDTGREGARDERADIRAKTGERKQGSGNEAAVFRRAESPPHAGGPPGEELMGGFRQEGIGIRD